MKKEQWYQTMSLADEKYAEEADPSNNVKRNTPKKVFISLIAACVCIAIVMGGIIYFKPEPDVTAQPEPYTAAQYLKDTFQWETTLQANTVKCMYRSKDILYTFLGHFNADTNSADGVATPEDKYVIASAMFGALYQTCISYDYETHFSLFYEEMPLVIFEQEKEYYCDYSGSFPEAVKKASQTCAELVAFDTYTLEYDLEPYDMTVQEFIEMGNTVYPCFYEFPSFDPSRIEDVAALNYRNVTVTVNGGFYLKDAYYEGRPFVVYKYDGHWYVWQEYMDTDLFYDYILSDPDENDGYYQKLECGGIIKEIRDNIMLLDYCNYVFYIGKAQGADKFSVGDKVTINYYRGMGLRVNDETGETHKLYRAYQITNYTYDDSLLYDCGIE